MPNVKWLTIDGEYLVNLKRKIGRGTAGTKVYQGKFGNKSLAVKKIPYNLRRLYVDKPSVFLDKSLLHENIVTYYHCSELKNNFYIVMDLCNCSLSEYVENCKELGVITKVNILQHVTQGLQYLHLKNYIHQDIRPCNILLSCPDINGHVYVKLSDYGITFKRNPANPNANVEFGCVFWGVPVVLQTGQETPKSDIFSLGSIFYYVLSWGKLIFPRVRDWLTNQPNLDWFNGDSLSKEIVLKMIQAQPADRPDTQSILKHPFFWSNTKTISFLIELSNLINNCDTTLTKLIKQNISEYAENICGENWEHEINDIARIELNENREANKGLSEKSIIDLIRVIRNKAIHYDSLKEEDKECFGTYPRGFHDYWTRKFPKLVPYLWEKMDKIIEANKNNPELSALTSFYMPAPAVVITSEELDLNHIRNIRLKTEEDMKEYIKEVLSGSVRDLPSEDLWSYIMHCLRHGIESSNNQGPLHLAAEWDSPELIRIVLAQGVDMYDIDMEGNTALHIAALYNSLKGAKALIECGAQVTINNLSLWTPLHICAENDFDDMARLLIANKADLNAADNYGRTPLHICCKNGSLKVGEILLQKEADADIVDKNEETPLHSSARHNSFQLAALLLRHNVNGISKTRSGKTPLHLCCIENSKETAQLLIQHGYGISVTDIQERLPIHYCAISDAHEIVQYLLEKGTDIDLQDNNKWTPFHYCCMNDCDKTAKLLLENNVDKNALNGMKETPLHILAWFNSTKCLLVCQPYIGKFIDVNPVSTETLTPLHFCAMKNFKEIAEVLIAGGANVNIPNKDDDTPLHLCAIHDSKEVAEVLIANAANVQSVNKNNFTPLHLTAIHNSKRVAEVLIT